MTYSNFEQKHAVPSFKLPAAKSVLQTEQG